MTQSEDNKKLLEHLKTQSLCLLTIWTAQIEDRLIELKKQGERSVSRHYDKIRQKRRIYRLALLDKLNKWKEDPSNFNTLSNEEMTYSNVEFFNKNKCINLEDL